MIGRITVVIILLITGVFLVPKASAETTVEIPVSTGLQDISDDTVEYLRLINLNVPPTEVQMKKGTYQGGGWMAMAYPNAMILHPDLAANWENLATRRAKRKNVDPQYALTILHEALHQIMGTATWRDDPAIFAEGSSLEEGLVDTVMADLGQNYLGYIYGPKMHKKWVTDSYSYSAITYIAEGTEVRERSMRATGYPWHSPQAFAWRVKMLRMTFVERRVEWQKFTPEERIK